MAAENVRKLYQTLELRRRKLRMSYAALAKRSHVSQPTVVRTLSGHSLNTGFGTVVAIAAALGMNTLFQPDVSAVELQEIQAGKRAEMLVGIVQGTSGLEAQALHADELRDLKRRTAHELMAGSPRKLWGD